jgi:hypothetical protein
VSLGDRDLKDLTVVQDTARGELDLIANLKISLIGARELFLLDVVHVTQSLADLHELFHRVDFS